MVHSFPLGHSCVLHGLGKFTPEILIDNLSPAELAVSEKFSSEQVHKGSTKESMT